VRLRGYRAKQNILFCSPLTDILSLAPLRPPTFTDYTGLLHQGAYGQPTVNDLGKKRFHSDLNSER